VEVTADHDQLGVHAPNQDIGYEIAIASGSALFVELQQEQIVDADVGEKINALLVIGKQQGRILGAKHCGWVLIERDHTRGESAIGSERGQRREHRAVASMNTIVRPNRNGGANALGYPIDAICEYLHRRQEYPPLLPTMN